MHAKRGKGREGGVMQESNSQDFAVCMYIFTPRYIHICCKYTCIYVCVFIYIYMLYTYICTFIYEEREREGGRRG